MNWAAHTAYFTHGIDPVVWLRVTRAVLFAVAGVLMFAEPMLCGGRNRAFHRMLGVYFLAACVHAWVIAQARMTLLIRDPAALDTVDMLAGELIVTVGLIVVVARLGYDVFRWRAYNRVKQQHPANCHSHFQP